MKFEIDTTELNKDEKLNSTRYVIYPDGRIESFPSKTEVAREIFEEIEEIRLRQIRKSELFRNGSTEEMERKFYEGAEWGLRQLSHWFAELKMKYITESEMDDDNT